SRSITLPPPISAPFPYTTLFRSRLPVGGTGARGREGRGRGFPHRGRAQVAARRAGDRAVVRSRRGRTATRSRDRRVVRPPEPVRDRKSTRLNSSHEWISYAVVFL